MTGGGGRWGEVLDGMVMRWLFDGVVPRMRMRMQRPARNYSLRTASWTACTDTASVVQGEQ